MVDDERRRLERLCRPIDHEKIRFARREDNAPLVLVWMRHGARLKDAPPLRRPYRGRSND